MTRGSIVAHVKLFAAVALVLHLNVLVALAVASPDDDRLAASIEEKVIKIIAEVRGWQQEFEALSPSRPFVTAAFAQSIDGYMAPYDGTSTSANFPLSGDESRLLTHALRSVHDGILVGARTLSIDNPRLTNRLWGSDSSASPRPIVLDSNLNHIRKLGETCNLKNPIVCCSVHAANSFDRKSIDAEILACECTSQGNLYIRDVLLQLKLRHGVRTVMVEGGAELLSSFFEQQVIDALCITIAPKLLHTGIAPTFHSSTRVTSPTDLASMSPHFVSLGQDMTLLSRYPSLAGDATILSRYQKELYLLARYSTR